ncbi:MAG: autotransporter domain-containing protein [Pseudodesulfovibrio sp.]|uniref:Outer membrane autotransporter barrel domain protein n=1 Tax=Pseudodesulfovibrio aespoeensis (strain ATCC 700646 / DSM 10631 / Aspo-2) TaxID=643562 RepID=E6VY05_PSEA9|nr:MULTISPECIES: autotransporter outer membrane beta-barrel domain-containing protein [Pseudodesulfovibrio]MBU4379223.1 autotransporter domain-containing protein [Pseudomonadota bacterium]ADU63819.1 outer membrane autotransporter barrel domain protein [Pseudodesulfovibrio aespoeensis Aspo-2]MBU4475587.1 autotransporter domain-containing protein [Pseudomonadota bacterium]MBU4515025.1 autotransporter domain-containing protein [Pseudomonadota bacterium]MBU4520840.1 autotransporter domain-containi
MSALQFNFSILQQMMRLLETAVFQSPLILMLIFTCLAGHFSLATAADIYGYRFENTTVQGLDETVSATATGSDNAFGIFLNEASLLQLNGSTTASSQDGTGYGVYLHNNCVLFNLGSIAGESTAGEVNGVYLGASSAFTNTGSISGTSSAGDAFGAQVWISSGATNSGTITGTSTSGFAYGVSLASAATLTNTGSISGTSFVESGYGAMLDTQSSATNSGTITGTSTIGSAYGISLGDQSTFINSGTLAASGDKAYGADLSSLSTLTNTGVITATSDSLTAYGVNLNTLATVINSGTVAASSTSYFSRGAHVDFSSTLTNTGMITSTSITRPAFGVVLDNDSKVINSGTVAAVSTKDGAAGAITSGLSTLTSTGTITATGDYVAYGVQLEKGSTFTNSGLVTATSPRAATGVYITNPSGVTSSNTFINTGSINAQGGTKSQAILARTHSSVYLDTGTRILNGSVSGQNGLADLIIRSDSDLGFTLDGNWKSVTHSGSGIWSLNGDSSASASTLTLNAGSKTTMFSGSRLTSATMDMNSGASLNFVPNSLVTVTGTATLNGAITVDPFADRLGSATLLTAGTLNTGADYSAFFTGNPNFAVNVTTTTGAGGSVSVSTAFAPQDDAPSLASTTILSSSQAFAGVAQSRNLGLLADMGDSDEDREIMVASIGSLDGLLNPRKEETPWGIYLQPVYSFGSRNGDASSKGYNYGMYGLEAGIDRRIGDDWVVGAMAGYGSSHMDFTGSDWVANDNEDQRLYTAGAYVGYRAGDWTFADTLSVTYADHKSKRKASATDTATAKYESWLIANEFLAVYHWSPAENWLVTPRAGVNVTHLHRPGFSESGSINALTYQTLDQFFSEGLVAVNVQRTFMKDDLAVTPYAGLGAVHSLTGNDITVKQYLTTTSAEVTTKNDDSRFTGELGMTFSAGSTKVTLGYAGEYSASSDSHSVFGQMRWEF